MSQPKILIDTNTYFRLAQGLHPLLKSNFGIPPCQVAITKDLEDEFNTSQRLQNKFGWFEHKDYVANRNGGGLSLSKAQKKQFQEDWPTVLGIANQLGYTDLSKEDINGITYALILGITLVTDDEDMTDTAKQLEVNVICTLELMKILMDCGHIDMAKVRTVAGYWVNNSDCPRNFEEDYERIFAEDPPKKV